MQRNLNSHKQLGAQILKENDLDCLVLNKQLTSHSEKEERERLGKER